MFAFVWKNQSTAFYLSIIISLYVIMNIYHSWQTMNIVKTKKTKKNLNIDIKGQILILKLCLTNLIMHKYSIINIHEN